MSIFTSAQTYILTYLHTTIHLTLQLDGSILVPSFLPHMILYYFSQDILILAMIYMAIAPGPYALLRVCSAVLCADSLGKAPIYKSVLYLFQ